ncbi:MAG: DUF3413 domain-containing protein [Bacteroidetes bacterium]|nr:DUF3413 domain-containing protein [Bacteroidota bacterium]
MQTTTAVFQRKLYLVFLLNLVVLFFISFQYIHFLENIEGFWLKIYLALTTMSHFFLLGSLPLLLSLLLFKITKSEKITQVIHIVLSAFLLMVAKLDTVIFEQFRYHLSPIVLKLVFGKRASDIFQFSALNLFLAVLFVVLLLVLQLFFYYLASKISGKNISLRVKPTLFLWLMALLSSHLVYAWSDANYFRPVTQIKNVFPVFYPLTADSLLMKLGLVDLEKAKRNEQMALQQASQNVQYPLRPIVSNTIQPKKNILYLVIDTWRNGMMNEQITPNIYAFSKKCQVFENHFSGSNMTTGGIFSLFYGIPATYFDTFTGQEIQPVMMAELQKQKYQLDILSSSNVENPPFNRNVFAHIPNLRLASKAERPADRDREINDLWLNHFGQLTQKKEPFFGFLFYDSAHGFDYPKDYPIVFKPSLSEVNYLELDDDYNPAALINRYKNSLHYIDSLIGQVLQQLEHSGQLSNTIVVITSDHGQEFNDNHKGYWQHGGNFTDYQIRTPMMIFDATKSPKTCTEQTLHYDLAPTIMQHYLGVKNPISEYSFGCDMYQPKLRKSFICGYNQRFAIIQPNQITNIYPSGLFDVTDKKLEPLTDEQINYELVTQEMKNLNRFFKKK